MLMRLAIEYRRTISLKLSLNKEKEKGSKKSVMLDKERMESIVFDRMI